MIEESTMTATLITFGPKGLRKEIPLAGNAMIVGRKDDADIRIPVGEVSRSHCQIEVNGQKVVVRDLGSSNGTFVNDNKITNAILKAGDRLRIGPVTFTLTIDGKPAVAHPPAAAPPPAPTARHDSPTTPQPPAKPATVEKEDEFDMDELEELDAEDLSDFDLDDMGLSGSGIIDDIDPLEDIDKDDKK
jgi:pSer/pThr/pTyr-binding forkhead associated (FHA) protein